MAREWHANGALKPRRARCPGLIDHPSSATPRLVPMARSALGDELDGKLHHRGLWWSTSTARRSRMRDRRRVTAPCEPARQGARCPAAKLEAKLEGSPRGGAG